MKEERIPNKMIPKYVEVLKSVPLFMNQTPKALEKILRMMTQVFIAGGERLIQEGGTDDSAYILIYGRLQIKKMVHSSSKEEAVAEIPRGEMVGEISLLTSQKRTASVYATRDSLVLKFTKEQCEAYQINNPRSAFEIAKKTIVRLTREKKQYLPGENVKTIAILPAGDTDHSEFANTLSQELSKTNKTLVIDQKACNEHFALEIGQVSPEEKGNRRLVQWLQEMEENHHFVLFVADRQMTPWTERCIREADHILFIADAKIHHALNSIELLYFKERTIQKGTDLIFVHPSDTRTIEGSNKWLEHRPVDRFQHMKKNNTQHLQKLVRILTGKAIGVVLNGGGARGYAHLGVLKAIEEYRIPIDFIGGTSMGACISGGYSFRKLSEMEHLGRDFAMHYRGDYTFPYIALVKGARATKYFRNWFKDINIEDLWTSFFCMSCNLSEGKPHVHDRGSLWKAVRMSTSIPALYPPVYLDGEMHVDGGIVDNMPVEVMRNKMKGGKIIAINCCCDQEAGKSLTYNTAYISGWKLLYESLFKQKKGELSYDNIVKIILLSINIASTTHQNMMSEQADYLIEIETSKYGILDFYSIDEIIQTGYETAIKYLSKNNII